MEGARSFPSPAELDAWLESHHGKEPELWVRIFKKGSGTPSVTWGECVLLCLAWGWIDGAKRSLDEHSFLQRLTPRRPKSNWSTTNRQHAERLIVEGRMRPSGLVHVEAARADGRWERAYAGSAAMVIPEDFLAALERDVDAKRTYASLKRMGLFVIYHRLQTAPRAETRAKRIEALVSALARGETPR